MIGLRAKALRSEDKGASKNVKQTSLRFVCEPKGCSMNARNSSAAPPGALLRFYSQGFTKRGIRERGTSLPDKSDYQADVAQSCGSESAARESDSLRFRAIPPLASERSCDRP